MGHQNGALNYIQWRGNDGRQGCRLLTGGVFERVLRRLFRIIVVNGSVVPVMMVGSLGVLDFVRNIPVASGSRPPALRSERVQGQQKQQEDANQSTHEELFCSDNKAYYRPSC
ncbi:MAG: hypothetical protein Q7T64_06055 [Lacisediminimonas sp.]|nr:hypothetical protein [Lacisediminimonas sp.]